MIDKRVIDSGQSRSNRQDGEQLWAHNYKNEIDCELNYLRYFVVIFIFGCLFIFIYIVKTEA
jgi:hypothetical protein